MTSVPSYDFQDLPQRTSPNHYLVCPENYANRPPDAAAPTYACPAETLRQRVRDAIAGLGRTQIVAEDTRQFRFTQTSRIFRFVDDVLVDIIPLGADRATLAIYSASRVGYSDLGANRRRVMALLAAIGRDRSGEG